ncbi:hypothetical protein WS74_0852 [Weissella ceti]|uniref:Uncharacterized protein n=1 Tax=Weissella ceti TaxID=759620 RepID=A0A088GMH2_9LACO|nr:hypothetical protein WS74_0852 [Weissella ceti]
MSTDLIIIVTIVAVLFVAICIEGSKGGKK